MIPDEMSPQDAAPEATQGDRRIAVISCRITYYLPHLEHTSSSSGHSLTSLTFIICSYTPFPRKRSQLWSTRSIPPSEHCSSADLSLSCTSIGLVFTSSIVTHWSRCSLYGIGIHQFYRYMRLFPTDAASIRVVVRFLGLLELQGANVRCSYSQTRRHTFQCDTWFHNMPSGNPS